MMDKLLLSILHAEFFNLVSLVLVVVLVLIMYCVLSENLIAQLLTCGYVFQTLETEI